MCIRGGWVCSWCGYTDVVLLGCYVFVYILNEACGCCVHIWWACVPWVWCPIWGPVCGVGAQIYVHLDYSLCMYLGAVYIECIPQDCGL